MLGNEGNKGIEGTMRVTALKFLQFPYFLYTVEEY
jgi:hypothetical protein